MENENLMVAAQSRGGRGLAGISQGGLAEKSGVAQRVISQFESESADTQPATVRKLQAALEAAGIEFLPENGGGVGVRLRAAVLRIEDVGTAAFYGRIAFTATYRGREIDVLLPTLILDDWDGYTGRRRTGRELEQSFNDHRNDVAVRCQALIDQGRALDDQLVLEARDFYGLLPGTRS
ncbi:MAG: helix-turn-helix transcriptional regulator [Pseudomonadota bacterium]